MPRDYTPLPVSTLQPGVTFHRPVQHLPERVTLDSPAVEVMTDFRQVTAVTVEPGATLDTANDKMIRNRVRLLLVVDDQDCVLGLITATDLLGEKPMQFIQNRGGTRRSDILVRDIMTPQERLEVLRMEDVLSAKVGHVVATLKKAGRQHAMVVDIEDGKQRVRGLFSSSQIARQLGAPIQTTEVARTFAEIGVMLAH